MVKRGVYNKWSPMVGRKRNARPFAQNYSWGRWYRNRNRKQEYCQWSLSLDIPFYQKWPILAKKLTISPYNLIEIHWFNFPSKIVRGLSLMITACNIPPRFRRMSSSNSPNYPNSPRRRRESSIWTKEDEGITGRRRKTKEEEGIN